VTVAPDAGGRVSGGRLKAVLVALRRSGMLAAEAELRLARPDDLRLVRLPRDPTERGVYWFRFRVRHRGEDVAVLVCPSGVRGFLRARAHPPPPTEEGP